MSGWHNKNFENGVKHILCEFFPHIDLRLVFSNNFSINGMFPFKDCIPKFVKSNIVYKYKCGICHSTYIGETTRHYTTRIAEHKGISPLTGAPMSKPNSHIYEHFRQTGHNIRDENFSILFSTDSIDIQLSESIAIHEFNPDLNEKHSSTPLKVLY